MDLEAVRRLLEERLAKLDRRTSKIESDLRKPGLKDSQEQATEAENDEVLEALNEAERAEIDDIRAALRRIDEGSYSACASCGDDIAEGRLLALPSTRMCVECAA